MDLLLFLSFYINAIDGTHFKVEFKRGFECSVFDDSVIDSHRGIGTDLNDISLSLNIFCGISEEGFHVSHSICRYVFLHDDGEQSYLFEFPMVFKEFFHHFYIFQLTEQVGDSQVVKESKDISFTTRSNGQVVSEEYSLVLSTYRNYKKTVSRLANLLCGIYSRTRRVSFYRKFIQRLSKRHEDYYKKVALSILRTLKDAEKWWEGIELHHYLKHTLILCYLKSYYPDMIRIEDLVLPNPFGFLANTNFSIFCETFYDHIKQNCLDEEFINIEDNQMDEEVASIKDDSRKVVLNMKIVLSSDFLILYDPEDIKILVQRSGKGCNEEVAFLKRGPSIILSYDDLKPFEGLNVCVCVKKEFYSNIIELRIFFTPEMRLVLNSIVLHNFKSYKDTHHIKNIDSSFTAIVGPNGSGKSNVIDSILFVLGFRAKKMRHAQVTDLIYNDGKREKECYVELIFNKFRIKREVNINKSTKYFIDGKDASSADVVKLMMGEGVDMEHNRFLILQGEIESIAMMKPKEGLLEFLEDIIGTSSIKKEIEDIQEEIKELEQTKTDSKTSLAFVKKDFDHAEELKKKNEEALKSKLEYLGLKAEAGEMNKELISRTIKKKEEEKEKLSVEIEELRSTNEETRKIFKTYEQKYQKIKKKLNDKEGAFLAAKRDYKKAERQIELQKEANNKIEKRRKFLKQEIQEIKSKNEMKREEKEIYTKELSEHEAELDDLYKSLEETKSRLTKEEKKTPKGDIRLLKDKEKELMALLDRKAEISHKSSKFSAEMKIKNSQLENLELEINNLKSRLEKIENTKYEDVDEKSLERLEKDILLTQKELQKRKSRFAEATQKKEADKKEEETMKHFTSVKGVVGRLKDVGSINPKYDTALSTACSKLNNIIVDTTSTADKCMEIIKKKNIPRSTVIVLEKIKEIPKLENLPYLFEKVECEEKFKKVFYFALGDTIVCDDLKEAEALAFGRQRRRVVTLDGKLIEKSGVMTGGKVVERVKSYEEIEKTLKKMEDIRNDLIKKLAVKEEKKKYETYKMTLKKLENEKLKEQKEVEDLRNRLKNLVQGDLDVKISKTKEEIDKVKQKMVNRVIRDLQAQLKMANEKIEILENRCQEIKIRLTEAVEESVEEKEKELGNLKEVEVNLHIDKEDFEKKDAEYNGLLSTFKEVQEELNHSKKMMGENYHNEIDLKNKYEDLEEKIGDLNLQIKKINSKKIREEIKEIEILLGKYSREKSSPLGEISYTEYSEEDIQDYLKKISEKIKKSESHKEASLVPGVFEEYLSIKESYEKALEDYERVSEKYKDRRNLLESLKNKRYDEFMSGFTQVSKFLKEIYKTLTYGGNAELELVDYLDPFSEGIVLAVMPPKKCWKNVSNLSGGEKTLSSLALIFALHKFKPSPFYVMDEIDAALDYRNVSIISSYLKEMTKNSQFIVISLRNDMFEMSNSVLGVYKTNNISKFLMINVSDLKKEMKMQN